MRRTLSIVLVGTAMMTAGCAMTETKTGSAASVPASASAALLDAGGVSKGRATVTQTDDGVRLTVDATGLTPGAHGLHIHTVGKCEPPAFTSAGPHWNPTGKMHGRDAANGPHMGDLPNLIAGADGAGHLEATISGARLTGGEMPLLDADGAAIVIHASADDYRTDPSGNSGARIACGIFAPKE